MSDTAPSTPVPKKGGKAAAIATPVDGEGEKDLGMPANDVSFLIDCLMSVTGGTISVDVKAVAEKRGLTNHRSVSNKISIMKKKYGLPFGSVAKIGEAGTPTKAPATKTPSTKTPGSGGKITKAKAAPKKKADTTTPSKKGKKAAVKKEEESEKETMLEDEEAEDEDMVDAKEEFDADEEDKADAQD